MEDVMRAPSAATIKLLQQRSNAVGGLVGTGLPHWMTLFEQSSVGGEGTKLTVWVQMALLPQQSTAFQTREIEPLQPAKLVVLPIRFTLTALQHGDETGGFTGGTGTGPPHGTV